MRSVRWMARGARALGTAILLLGLLVPGRVAAAPAEPGAGGDGGEDQALRELMQILDEQTQVATRTRMNGDYVPGIVTVLHGEELMALGLSTVWEALAQVPGVQLQRADVASPTVAVRGMSFPRNSGDIKVLINSVPMSREESGVNSSVLLLPTAQVDRIEVLRGSGSAVHGGFAAVALVNIVTRRDENALYGEFRGPEDYSVAGSAAWRSADRKSSASLSLAGFKSDDADAAAPLLAEEERGSAFLSFERGGFSILGQVLSRDRNERQPAGVPPVPGVRAHEASELSGSLSLNNSWKIAPDLRLDARALAVHSDQQAFPTDFEGPAFEVGADLFATRGRHSLLGGVGLWHSRIDEATQIRPPPAPGAPLGPPLQIRDQHRRIVSVTAQDQFQATEALALTAGLRFDHLSDVGSHWSPRLALVWRAAARHILKAQYSEAFRPPSFFELYESGGLNEELGSVSFRTVEFNYVFRREGAVGRATLFHSSTGNEVRLELPRGFFNVDDGKRVRGVELEWSQELRKRIKLESTVSYIHSRDRELTTGEADWLVNLALIAQPARGLLLTGRFHHIGERQFATREVDGLDLFDLSASFQAAPSEGLTLRAGVKNVFDEEMRIPLFRPIGQPTDLVFRGRTGWAAVGYRF